jgi:hypothetical protein
MNEKPKSIWTRPWQGGFAQLLGWFTILALAIFLIVLAFGFIANEAKYSPRIPVQFALIAAVGSAAIIMALMWLARWLRSWRNWKRLGFGFACFLTLTALFYAVENFRGIRAWNHYRLAGEARGEKFDMASVTPAPVPDAENYAMQPIWVGRIAALYGNEMAKAWYGDKVAALGHTNFTAPLDLSLEVPKSGLKNTNQIGNWQLAQKTDLLPWQSYFRALANITNIFSAAPQPQSPAADVLLALSRYDDVIEQLRTASKLPHARFPVCYTDANPAAILLPHLASLKGCTIALQLRTLAELQANQPDQALADIELMLRNNDAIRIEPFLISHLVNIAMLQIEVQPIWEGLADRRWNEVHLRKLDTRLGKLDFLADHQAVVMGEQAATASLLDYLQQNREEIKSLIDRNGWASDQDSGQRPLHFPLNAVAIQAIPRGWFEQNKISAGRFYSDFGLRLIDPQRRLYSAATAAKADSALAQLESNHHPYNWFMLAFLPTTHTAAKNFIHAQTTVNFARLAVALERHRLAHGHFPDNLAALTPQFLAKLPHDVINGQPLKYRRTDDGSFILYSVGWNETDEGGIVALTKGGAVDSKKGDWVWRYPAN